MPVTEIILTAVAGAALKHVLKVKLGDYVDPDNLLNAVAADTVEDIAVAAFLKGGVWVITQVRQLEPTDPRVEDKLNEALEAARQEKLRQLQLEEEAARKSREKFHVFNSIFEEVEKLEAILRRKGQTYSLGAVLNDVTKNILFEATPVGLIFGLFGKEPTYSSEKKVSFGFTNEEYLRSIRINLGEEASISITTKDDGRIVVEVSGYYTSSKQMYESAEPVIELIMKKVAEFLQ